MESGIIPKHCYKCGEKIPADADFCPECGTRVTLSPPTKPKMRMEKPTRVASHGNKRIRIINDGALVVFFVAVAMLVVGIMQINNALHFIPTGRESNTYMMRYLIVGLIQFFCFITAVIGGVSALRKTSFSWALVGSLSLIVASLIMYANYPDPWLVILFGLPPVASLLVFIWAKVEFKS